jgi:hypothetical protein
MRANNRFCKGFPGVIRFQRSQLHHRIQSHSLIETLGSDPAVSLKPGDLILRFQWHSWIRFHCLIETTKSFFKCSSWIPQTDPQSYWNCGNWFLQFHWNRRNQSCGLIETAESELCKKLSQISKQLQSHMWNGFSLRIRALGGIVWGPKISWHTVPLSPLLTNCRVTEGTLFSPDCFLVYIFIRFSLIYKYFIVCSLLAKWDCINHTTVRQFLGYWRSKSGSKSKARKKSCFWLENFV